MANLKEIRGRIASVKSTLKITSAMRLISSAKLIAATKAVGASVPYREALRGIMDDILHAKGVDDILARYASSHVPEGAAAPVAVVLVTSNQTLCGSFNVNVLKQFEACRFDPAHTLVYAVGRFGMKAARKLGYKVQDCCKMAEKPDYDASASLATTLVEAFLAGETSAVDLVYTHFVSAGTQVAKVEHYLPFSCGAPEGDDAPDYIVEPDPREILESLLPRVIRMTMHTTLLDAAAAEHAARTLAMQVASDNANDLIAELSLTYNKLRQQAITNEILDLVGGQTE